MRIPMKDHLTATTAGVVLASVVVISCCPTTSTWRREPFKSVNTQLWQVSKTKWLLKARHSRSTER
uniref:Uncharacterized protein n=1 Tax=Arundo donax TaxID=35708 RepID=A0A0A9D894_ARUDO